MTIRRTSALNTVAVPLIGLASAVAGCDPTPAPKSQPAAHPSPATTNPSHADIKDNSATPEHTQTAAPASSSKQISQSSAPASQTRSPISVADLPPLPEPNYVGLTESIRAKITEARAKVEAAPMGSLAVCELGALYFGVGQIPQAITCFRRGVALAPATAPPRYLLAIALAQSGDNNSAIRELEQVIKSDPAYMPARIRQADLQFVADKARAADLYRRAIAIAPDAPFLHQRLGQCLLAMNETSAAEKEFLKAVELQPDYGEAHAALADLYVSAKNAVGAANHRSLAMTGKPGRAFPDPLYTGMLEVGRGPAFASSRAIALAADGQIIEAIRLLNESLLHEPNDLKCIATLAAIYESIGKYHAAAEYWGQVYATDMKWPGGIQRLANAYAESDQIPKAIGILKSHVVRAPEDTGARYWLALLLARNNEHDAALEEGRLFLEKKGETAESLCQSGHVLIECSKFEEAARRLDKAQSLEPPFFDVHFYRALLHARADDAGKAYTEFDEFMAKKPNALDGYVEAAKHAAKQHNWERSIRILRTGIERKPNAPILAAQLAQVLATCPDASIRNGKEAVKLADQLCLSTGMSYYAYLDILGEANAEAGDFDRAGWAIGEAINSAAREQQADLIPEYERRQKLYKSRTPYHLEQ